MFTQIRSPYVTKKDGSVTEFFLVPFRVNVSCVQETKLWSHLLAYFGQEETIKIRAHRGIIFNITSIVDLTFIFFKLRQ
jgi:hypothetical protein